MFSRFENGKERASAPAAPKKATEPIRQATPPVQRPAVKPPVSENPPAARAAKDDMFSRHRGPLRDLTAKAKARSGSGDDQGKDRPSQSRRDSGRGATRVRVAAMPDVKQPKPAPRRNEEKVQKPDIALPQDAIRKAKQGGGVAPLQQFTDTTKTGQDKKRKDKGKASAPAEPQDGRPLSGRGRKSRGDSKAQRDDSPLGNTREARTAKRTRRRPSMDDVGGNNNGKAKLHPQSPKPGDPIFPFP